MESINGIANDLFYKVRSRFSGLKLGTETGEITIIPEDARFFDFDYKDEDSKIGHITISIAEPNSMKVYFSTNITEDMDTGQKDNWYRFLKELRGFAKRRLLSFDTRDITKDSLDRRDYEFLTRNAQSEPEKGIGESVMNESQMYGTRNTSYQKLLDTKLIVKHNQSLQDDYSPGARSRNISALFIENQEGERFKYPFIHLAGARAMQRHVANGGLPYDDLGKSIIGISEEIAQLKSFSNYVVRNDLMNSENNSIVERSIQALSSLRETISRLAKQKYYEEYKNSFQIVERPEVPEDVIEDYTNKFTVKNFNENIKNVFPIIYRLMKETGTVDYDDIVSMTTTESINDTAEIDLSEENLELEEYENWILSLGEDSPLQTDQAQLQAIDNLNLLIAQALPAGANGQNAILSLKGIIDDNEFHNQIRAEVQKTKDPMMDVRPLIQAWAEENASTILDQLDFGDMGQETEQPETEAEPQATEPAQTDQQAPATAAAAEPETLTLSDEPSERYSNKVNVQDLAEFINSFYDRNTGMFPKGPEGVCTMVGKKFGEQAERVARRFVERMAPHQEQGAEELEELARMKELSGMRPQQGMAEEHDFQVQEASPEGPQLAGFSIDSIQRSSATGTAYIYDPQTDDEIEVMVEIDFDRGDETVGLGHSSDIISAWITDIRDPSGKQIDPDSVEYDEDEIIRSLYDKNESDRTDYPEESIELEELTRVKKLAGLEKKNLATVKSDITMENRDSFYNVVLEEEEIEVAFAFERDSEGKIINPKIILGTTDITAVVDEGEIQYLIDEMDPGSESPITGVLLNLDISVDFDVTGEYEAPSLYSPGSDPDLELGEIAVRGKDRSVDIKEKDLDQRILKKIEKEAWEHAEEEARYSQEEAEIDRYERSRNDYDRYENAENTAGLTSEDAELSTIKRLSGISQGLGI